MDGAISRFCRVFRRFASEERAVAVVEFALVLPFMLLLYLGSIEASALMTVDRKVLTIASTSGDLVARWNEADDGTIPLTTVNDYFRAAEGIIMPYPNAGLEQVVSVIFVASDGAATVRWSRSFGGGTARTPNSAYPLAATSEMNLIARNSCLVASETRYLYWPVLGRVFTETFDLRHESLYVPRFEDCIAQPS